MTTRGFLALAMTLATLGACTEKGTYPLSGEECTADDVVLEMSVDCPALTGTGSF